MVAVCVPPHPEVENKLFMTFMQEWVCWIQTEIYKVPRRKKGRRVCSVRISNIFREAHCFFPSLISSLVSSVSVSPSLPAKWWLSTSEIIHKSFFYSNSRMVSLLFAPLFLLSFISFFLLFCFFFIVSPRPSLSSQHLVPLFAHSGLSFPF